MSEPLVRTGQITKPLYAVPNHMLDQFAAEFRQLYPMADVLVATKTDLEASSPPRRLGLRSRFSSFLRPPSRLLSLPNFSIAHKG